jgi:excisionase family DNA binding protein
MLKSVIKNYDDLPLFLNAEQIAEVLGISRASAYSLMNSKSFPSLQVGKRLLVSKTNFRHWAEDSAKVSYINFDSID